MRETITQGTTTRILDFIYDESGRPFAMRYSPNGGTTFGTYYYVLNLQGDVVKLITSGGTVIANYEYNAWGELLSVTNSAGTEITTATHVGLLNPLRYRGYYFDSETGFYYLQSRYYDPVTHRFINADSLASTGQGVLGTNMFAYCLNNPVASADYSGCMALELSNQKYQFSTINAPASGSGGGIIITPIAFDFASVIVDWIMGSRKSKNKEKQGEPTPPNVTAPEDPSTPPGDDYEWRGQDPVGGDRGAWVNKETGEQWHPDLNHGEPIGPHWDYKDPNGIWWRVFENGQVVLK